MSKRTITISLRFYVAMLAIMSFNTLMMGVFAAKWMREVDRPRSVCVKPFTPTQLERAETEPPNMMTVSLVRRFRHQNKG